MTREEVMTMLHGIFQEVLKKEEIVLTDETTAHDVDGWDSVTNVMSIDEIEKRVNISFKLRDIIKIKNVGGLCDKIVEKLA